MANVDFRDFSNAGTWPMGYKLAVCGFAAAVILLLGWFLLITDKRDQIESLERTEQTLRTEFQTKQERAANLEPLKEQLAQMEVMLQQMLRQLPSRTEMPDLIVDISQTALASGISNELFQPGPEVPREFYAEKPIALRMVGSYHQFGAFVSGVASLPRVVIMTMHDISLRPRAGQAITAGSSALMLEGTVRTYRYLDEDEIAEQAPPAPATGRRR
jgi:type IV pilus assembly protein PilO